MVSKAVKKNSKAVLCERCSSSVPPKPRSVMPIGHAFMTVQGILIDRLDGMVDDIARIVAAEIVKHYQVDQKTLAKIAGRVVDGINYKFFPEAYEEGESYTPDPSGRMDVPVRELGLIPKLPTIAIYARHLLEKGKSSPVCESLPGVFTDAELARLGERIERREALGR